LAALTATSVAWGVAVGTLEDLEARVAALEASQADYDAALAAVNALLSAR
jgi:hypothetical protein